jgi:dihydroxyacetone kinase-like protein
MQLQPISAWVGSKEAILLSLMELRSALVQRGALTSKVAIITGGGSEHLPVFLGYVGKGLAHGVAVGNVFSSPNSEQILEATKAAHGGAGVLFLYGNYMGDVLNFDMAAEMAEFEGIAVRTVKVCDDVASAPRIRRQNDGV